MNITFFIDLFTGNRTAAINILICKKQEMRCYLNGLKTRAVSGEHDAQR